VTKRFVELVNQILELVSDGIGVWCPSNQSQVGRNVQPTHRRIRFFRMVSSHKSAAPLESQARPVLTNCTDNKGHLGLYDVDSHVKQDWVASYSSPCCYPNKSQYLVGPLITPHRSAAAIVVSRHSIHRQHVIMKTIKGCMMQTATAGRIRLPAPAAHAASDMKARTLQV